MAASSLYSAGGRASQGVETARLGELLDAAEGFFRDSLWTTEAGAAARARLARAGIEEPVLRSFGIGHAPGNARLLLDHLAERGYEPAELAAAGIATRSGRDRIHAVLHARIIFPLEDSGGELLGFAGLAMHLGPSWPLWQLSAEGGPLDTGSVLFGLRQASRAIADAGRALVVRDCVQVLDLHQQGRTEAVAVVQSPITRHHTALLAERVGVEELHQSRRDGTLGVALTPSGSEPGAEAFGSLQTRAGFSLAGPGPPTDRSDRSQGGGAREMRDSTYGPLARPAVYVAGVLIGTVIPIGLLLLAGPEGDEGAGAAPALNVVIVGVAVVYATLVLAAGMLAPRLNDPNARRMRLPWARGSDEWQPKGWTSNWLEELLVGAALVSAVVCVVLLMTLGGFTG